MMTLISLAIVVAFATSWAGTLGFFEVEIWWELATLITIMLLGHWLEMRSIAQARGALRRWRRCCPTPPSGWSPTAPRSPDRQRCGRRCRLVRPGARVPADGDRGGGRRGRRRVDDHGRVQARRQAARRPVVAGTVAAGGSLRVRVTAAGDADGAVGHHAPGRAGAGIGVAHAGTRRPGRSAPVLRRARSRRDHPGRLVVARRPRGCAGADGDRPGDRLSARPRPGDPAGDRDLHLARRPERAAGQGPSRAGAGAGPSTRSSSTRPAP